MEGRGPTRLPGSHLVAVPLVSSRSSEMFCWPPLASRVHGAVQVLQPVLPLPPALLQEAQTVSRSDDQRTKTRSLTLSFLNSSYSGLSVGSSSLHSGQVLVCRWTHRGEGGVSEVGRGRGLAVAGSFSRC